MSLPPASTFSDLERYGALGLEGYRPIAPAGPMGRQFALGLLMAERRLLGLSEIEYRSEGATGFIFRATQPALGRAVAVKVAKHASIAPLLEPLQRQAAGMARLDHPSIPRLFSCAHLAPDGPACLVLEWIDGEPLAERLAERARPIEAEEVLRLAGELARAMRHAHARGVLHGDLRPENVLLPETAERPVVLLDWWGAASDGDAPSRPGTLSPCSGPRRERAPFVAEPSMATDLRSLEELLAGLAQRLHGPVPPVLRELAATHRAGPPSPRSEDPAVVGRRLCQLEELGR